MSVRPLPRLLVIDDLLGRIHTDRPNRERANLCGQYLLEDVTGDQKENAPTMIVKAPVAQACFCRGQRPACAVVGDRVENALEDALNMVRRGWSARPSGDPPWALVLLDLCFYTGSVTVASNRETLGMPEGRPDDDLPDRYFGITVLEEIRRQFPGLPVVLFSSRRREDVVDQFSKLGAEDFLPREVEQAPHLLSTLLQRHALLSDETGAITGRSIPLLVALRDARRLAPSRQSVLIAGERGSGKESLAQYIHRHRFAKGKRPFVAANSSVFTPELFASELFGIEARVATGVERRGGLIRSAEGGDLFLDEIRHMPPQVQVSILRVLEDGKVQPVGSTAPQPVNVSFIFATNSNLDALSVSGGFSPDLLDRIRSGGSVSLPPLRDRIDDLPLLVDRFLRSAEKEYGAVGRDVSPQAMQRLGAYHWPGNIRELRTAIYHAVRSYPGVERLAPIHLQLADVETQSPVSFGRPSSAARPIEGQSSGDSGIGLPSASTDDMASGTQLAGSLRNLQDAYAAAAARLVRAALIATNRVTPDNPEGRLQIHPAIKLLLADPALSASKAADVIKKFLSLSPKVTAELLSKDPILREAMEKARKLRPGKTKRSSDRN